MFGLFKPKCPLDASRKARIEYRLAWLCQQFGVERMRDTQIVLPTDPRLTSYDGTEEGARKLFATICEILHVSSSDITLEFGDELEMHGVAGLYYPNPQDVVVQVAKSRLGDGQTVVAVMTHELAHHVLMNADSQLATAADHEDVTDLFAVYNGFAIFSANSVIRSETKRAGNVSWWDAHRPGYLTAAEFGYALAVRAIVCNEAASEWQEYLRLDARASMNAGVKYICSTGDYMFQQNLERGSRPLSNSELLADLASEFDGNRVAAMWAVERQKETSAAVIDAVTDNLDRKSDAARRTAIQTLKQLGAAARPAIPALLEALKDGDPAVRAEAAQAVGAIQADATTLPHLEKLICDSDDRVVYEAADAIARCGSPSEKLLKELKPALRTALVKCNYRMAKAVAVLVVQLSPQPEEKLHEWFADDEELMGLASESLAELKAEQATPAVASSTS